MLLQDFRNKVRVDLSDQDKTYITNDVLDRALDRAVSDLSRFLPLSKVLEVTFDITVTDEAWTSGAAAGTYVALANKPIKYQTETVKNTAGSTMVRDTDYTIKYHEGKITHITSSDIGDAEGCTISYTKSQLVIDLTSIEDELIRVERLEYPYGSVPQEHQSYNLVGNYLVLVGEGINAQEEIADKDHALVEYKAKHTVPIGQTAGTFPKFLDDTVVLASDAYTLFSLAMMHEHQAVAYMTEAKTSYLDSIAAIHILVDSALDRIATYSAAGILEITDVTTSMTVSLAAAATALGNMGAGVADAGTALAKVITYCETNTDGNANEALKGIKDNIAYLRTLINTELAAAHALTAGAASDCASAAGVWTDIEKHILEDSHGLPNAQTYLEAGDDLIDLSSYTIGTDTIAERIEDALDGLALAATSSTVFIRDDTETETSEKYVKLCTGVDTGLGIEMIEDALDDMHKFISPDSELIGDARWHLGIGELLINEVNKGGKQVPVLYKDYADTVIKLAMALKEEADSYTNKATLYYRLAELYKDYSVASQNISTAWGISTQSLVDYMRALSQQALTYRDYAESTLNMGKLWGDNRDSYVTQAGRRNDAALAAVYVVAQRVAVIKSYIEESQGWNSIALTFVAEAETRLKLGAHYGEQARGHLEAANTHSNAANTYARLAEVAASEGNSRIAEIDRYMGQASHLINLAAGRRETADRLRQDAIERRNEAWTIWRSPHEYVGEFSRSYSARQTA